MKYYVVFLVAYFFTLKPTSASNASRSDSLDIRKTIIHFDMTDVSNQLISANCKIIIKSKLNNISLIQFDLEGLMVDSIKLNGNLNSFSHLSPNLQIPLTNPLNIGDSAEIDVYYHGTPIVDATWGGFYFSGNYAFQMGVGFNAQPHSFGRTWHPCFDNIVERSPYEFFITTTADKLGICNGILIDSSTININQKLWHWKLEEEIPSYLASVACCNYLLVQQNLTGLNGSMKAEIACEPADSLKVAGSFGHLQDSYSMLEENFGPYSWPKVGYTLVPFNAGAMEHATNIHIGRGFVDGTLNNETLIAHELSHHWWGDLVTCSTAGDMWLNEGFASYCESLHQEYTYGSQAYITHSRNNHFDVLSNAHIRDQGYRAIANMDSNYTYGSTVYNKGADAIHTLRTYLGDSLFFNGTKAFLQANKFKAISSIDLRDFLSTWTGKNLNNYFDNWIFQPGFTNFCIDSTQVTPNGSQFNIKVFLRQRKHHSSNYYNGVPLELGFYNAQMQAEIYSLEFNG
ncbi:MAG: M1 family metallopeptidase, partial [Chitinophagaceae bacterium]|nr:M1 family metallopeptidase [Chitinophagaceae bacterium]